jgi:uncharacterized protein
METVVEYEWDERKAAVNRAKHGIDFHAIESFDWATAGIFDDLRFDYGEKRYIAIGYIGNRLHAVTYTDRNGKTRIIGLRKANAKERIRYEAQKKTTSH